ncbi:hypothetical protein [Olsenella profusa]
MFGVDHEKAAVPGQGVVAMTYPYLTMADNVEVVHSELIHDNGVDKVFVHFERPTGDGFDSARCELPLYMWTEWEGHFIAEGHAEFGAFLSDNARLIYRYAPNGGVKVA